MAWAPDYVTVGELREYATRHTDTDDDAQIALAATAASRAVDRHCNRQFGLATAVEERVYTPVWDRRRCRWVIEVDDVMTTDDLVVTLTAGTLTAYTLEPRNAAALGRPWTRIVVDTDSAVQPAGTEFEAVVDLQPGWTTTPDPVKQATLLQGHRILFRRNSPSGVAGSPDVGSELRLLARLDPDVAVVLGPFVRWWAAA